MTWEEVSVPAVRHGEQVTSHLRFTSGDVCIVEVRVGDDLDVRGEGPDLFEALVAARRGLEANSVRLACNGARRDMFLSPMLRRAVQGRRGWHWPTTAAELVSWLPGRATGR